jgi:hypothetical protein
LTDWALTALGFRAGAEGAVFTLVGGLPLPLARPAAMSASLPSRRQTVIAAIAEKEAGDALGLKTQPFGLKTLAARSVGSIEIDRVHGSQSGVLDPRV